MTETLTQKKARLAELKAQIRTLEAEIRFLSVYPETEQIRVREAAEYAKGRK